jgi:hypothetical protein
MDESGTQVTEALDICNVARNYFVNIFQKQNSTLPPVLDAISPSISVDDNINLTAPFSLEEFREALFSMKADKCPGPDGFNPGFTNTFGLYAVHKFTKNVVLCSLQVFSLQLST